MRIKSSGSPGNSQAWTNGPVCFSVSHRSKQGGLHSKIAVKGEVVLKNKGLFSKLLLLQFLLSGESGLSYVQNSLSLYFTPPFDLKSLSVSFRFPDFPQFVSPLRRLDFPPVNIFICVLQSPWERTLGCLLYYVFLLSLKML